MRKSIFILGVCSMLTLNALAQNKKSTIPFRLTSYNNIIIKAVLNNQDSVKLMFHTAASDVSLIESAVHRLKSIKINGTVDSVKSWGGDASTSDFSLRNVLKIGDMEKDSITIWKDKNSGQESDGKFGMDFFENKVVEVDFDKSLMTIQDALPKKSRKYTKFKLNVVDGNYLFIQAICQTEKGNFENKFLLHTGYAGDVLLDDKFVSENNIGQQIKITGERKLKDAFGNTLISKKGILPSFKIGDFQLANVPIGFLEGTKGIQKMSFVGGDILKRFNWIIDAKREFIYLKPNGLFSTTFSAI